MKSSAKPVVLGIGGLLVIVFIAFGMGLFGSPSDQELIHKALTEALKASKEGRPGGVMEYISNDLSIGGETPGTRNITDAIKKARPDLTLSNQDPTITGDTAEVKTNVSVALTFPPQTFNVNNVTIHLKKEGSRRMLIFPAKDWIIESIDVAPNTLEDLKNQFGGM